MPEPGSDADITDIARALSARTDSLVTAMAELIAGEMEFYRSAVVSREDLLEGLRGSVGFILAHLTSPTTDSADVTAPSATGRKRALQGAPLPEILRCYRLSFAYFWEQLLAEAESRGEEPTRALLAAATKVWTLADIYALALTDAYREAAAQQMLETDRRRSALVAALVDGELPVGESAWEIARMLDFPYQGTFVVLTAEADKLAEPPLAGLEPRLRALHVRSAWRAQPGHEIAVLSLPAQPTAFALEAIGACATGRVGVSPVYHQLDHTGRALRYAQVALESLPPAAPGVRQLDDTPLTELVMTNLDTTRRAVNRVLGGLLSLPEAERTTLLATARGWLAARGSAAEAAKGLYCHENTVRYRMRRLEEFLRGPLEDPLIVAELAMALDAVGTFPTLLGQSSPPERTERHGA
ncbi:hypothetical protein ABH931_002004 [Streptacidiphilus sp. MAP12-33]|uniref:PucR family transcriptional regulator n=1 Tax=Streptacidiphilus sp. MAP12-33 TaxID=3156266 RepID=UPI0035161BDC